MIENHEKTKNSPRRIKFRIGICGLLLLIGIGGFTALAGLKKPPAEVKNGERPLRVTAMRAEAEAVQVSITGYGQVKPLNEVLIAAEVAGRVVSVHPRLDAGETIAREEVLFQIDSRNYEAAMSQAQAEVDQLTTVLLRLEKQGAIDKDRLKTLMRSRELASAEYERIRDLFEQHGVGTRSGVDRAEQALNAAVDQSDQMAMAVSLYPLRIKEARSSLAAARARLEQARINLQRCRVTAPFDGRIKAVNVEKGQYVAPGQGLLTLADDTQLEIQVPLDSREAGRWLHFENAADRTAGAWFDRLKPVTTDIRWTEAPPDHVWKGTLHRVVDFDPKTRTITVAVRISGAAAVQNGSLPLVEGMFCEVTIPGVVLPNAFRIPRQAVGFHGSVFTVVDHRLKTVSVEVAREDGDHVLVVNGLDDGDTIITTRLVDPLEGALVEIVSADASDAEDTPL